MRKFLTAFFAILMMSPLATTVVVAQDETTIDSTPDVSVQTDVSDRVFDIYVREGCPHCAQVKAWVKSNDLEDKVNYIETYNNPGNVEKLDNQFEKYDAPNSDRGVPFMPVDDDTYVVGDTPIINLLASEFGREGVEVTNNTQTTQVESSGSDRIILIVGALLLFGIVGYGIYSTVTKQEK